MDSAVLLAPPSPESARKSLADRAAEVEQKVRAAYERIIAPQFPEITLAAVGGFGRAQLFPYSDVDLLILIPSGDQAAQLKDLISSFLQTLWDAGVRPSHSVHTIAECAVEQEDNAELTISLLDRRFLTGNAALYAALDQNFRAFISKRGAAVARQLANLAALRRGKFQNTIYHLEPNVKDSPGGLRDLQTVHWLRTLHPRDVPSGLDAAFDFLAAVRIRLHELAERDQNVLTFDAQESLSDDPASLMRDYYRHARLVDRAARQALEATLELRGSLLGRFHEWRSRLSTADFTVVRDQILLRRPQHLPKDLSLFEFAALHKLRLAPDAIDRLRGFTPHTDWEEWKRLLALPHASFGLRAMQESETLALTLPEWQNIEYLVVRDFYHTYTVDEHTLVAIESFENISDGRFKGLFEEMSDPALVRFALLTHDIGKGSGTDHVIESRNIAHSILERLGAPEADRATIEFLIEKHLALSSVMTSRDLSDASTARMLASQVGTIERLKQLAMLTYADISAVNPQALTPWRLERLWRAYLLAHEELTRELGTERIHDVGGADQLRAQFLEGLPTRYLRTHTPEEIDGHYLLAKQLETRPLAIEITHGRGAYRLTLLTRDRPALFAPVAGAISSFGLNILKAEAFSNARGIVVDTFTFSDPHKTLELNPPELDRLRGIVRKVVEGKQDADKLLRGRPKPLLPSRASRLKPSVSFNDDASEDATLIEIVAQDRPGLLYDLARAITAEKCDIDVVLIDTEAHKALDVFYVSKNGAKLPQAEEASLRSALIAACLAS